MMASRTEITNQNYRGHPYELTFTYAQRFVDTSLVAEHLTKAGVVVDGKRVYAGTRGFVLDGYDVANVKNAVVQYIDYLEQAEA